MAEQTTADAALSLSPPCSDDAVTTPPVDHKFRKLRLRKARFQGRQLQAPAATYSSSPPSSAAALEGAALSPPASSLRSPDYEPSSPGSSPGALQELSTSTMRRRQNRSRQLDIVPLQDHDGADENTAAGRAMQHYVHSPRRSSIPIKIARPSKAARASTGSRRSISSGESRYIEHLESQLAALQTQVQSLTSPSSTRTQSAKLRAMNAESKLFRQELADWEQKFNERIQEQMEEHQMVTAGLRSQIRALERSVEESRTRAHELIVESEFKSKGLAAMESANCELERRVDFLSELVASSPGKIDLHAGDGESGRPLRQRPVPPARLFSPERQNRLSINTKLQSAMFSPDARRDSRMSDLSSSFDAAFSVAGSDGAASHIQLDESDEPESPTIVEANEQSTQRFPWIKTKTADAHHKAKPNRRMRRFYTGALGPRALILPATTNGSSGLAATGSPSTPCPTTRYHSSSIHSLSDLPLPYLPATDERGRPSHRRCATWDQDDRSSYRERGLTLDSPQTFLASPPGLPLPIDIPPSVESERSKTMRLLEVDQAVAGNLYDEIGHLRFDSSSEMGPSRPGTSADPTASIPRATTTDNARDHENMSVSSHDGQLTLYAKSPHSQDPSDTSIGTIARRPAGVFRIFTAIFSRTLHLYSLGARNIVSNAWHDTALSRPIVEFRWWLVRILIGRVRYRNTARARLRAASQGLGLGLAASPLMLPCPPADFRDDDPSLEADCIDLAYGELRPLSPRSHWTPSRRREATHQSSAGRSVGTWLKFSATLIFAVGLAIKDGPASLLGERDDELDLLAIEEEDNAEAGADVGADEGDSAVQAGT